MQQNCKEIEMNLHKPNEKENLDLNKEMLYEIGRKFSMSSSDKRNNWFEQVLFQITSTEGSSKQNV